MRVHIPALIAFVLINLLVDALLYRRLRRHSRLLATLHTALSLLLQVLLVVVMLTPFADASVSDGQMRQVMWGLWIYIMAYVPKYVGLFVAVPSALPLMRPPGRRVFARLGVVLGLLTLAVMVWGTWMTPRQIALDRLTVASEHLPDRFDNYRIVHISDLHLGTYGHDDAFVRRVVERVNALQPDLIAFTGDLVSRRTSEAEPFVEALGHLRARDGVVAVLGNHDYDDYCHWPDSLAKARDHRALCRLQQAMGWTLLENEHHMITRQSDTLLVVGEENYGEGHFVDYSCLSAAYPDSLRRLPFKILLQHNPSQWRRDIVGTTDIDLTLSGHTHGMQFMLTLSGRRYSPAAWRYGEWGGLYTVGDQHLNVNIGLGMVGVPMRIGATPEISLITLKRRYE